ncbi:LOB domain-containing protein 38-like [Neltuma alba]|uniref:LOB domain-containing protein 38-like n=1 Tax=Neltuma alba TaxID=207710 RepID=UPI0010A39AE0|nr:LOB domain-containing protein 38-like [Prosopis alba]XP_028788338.1 LOB domain-containing protein 38-like [Prosopis alba]
MSCNGCRVLRKGCSDDCMLRDCLLGIESPQAQAHATVFVAKFFGRAALMSFVSAVPSPQRSALFRSLLYEAVGRTINPVNGAVGLLWTGNWHLCQSGVQRVLYGGALTPLPDVSGGNSAPTAAEDDCFGPVLDLSRQRDYMAGLGSSNLKRKVRCYDFVLENNIQARDHLVDHQYCLGRSGSPERVVVVGTGRKDDGSAATPSEGSETSTLGSSAAQCGTAERKLLRLFF